jgi:pimeloyl-ACP methyl ester carboxylesterase
MTLFPPAVHHTLSGRNAPDDDTTGDGPVRLAVHELGEGSGRPPVVFCHGFPELAYSWRYQLPAVADAGFRAIAPDQRGYGGSTAPEEVTAYGIANLCGDLADLLDTLEVERAVFVGHDWGGFVSWAMPVLFPERCAGAVGVCTPYMPQITTPVLRSMFPDPEKMYMLWFQEPGVAEAVMDPQADLVFRKLMRGGVDPAVLMEEQMARPDGPDLNPFRRLDELPELGDLIVSAEELEVFGSTFGRTGFRGGINWYRNLDANAARFPHIGTTPLDLPTLQIGAEWDPALSPALAAGMPQVCSDLEMEVVARAGHWVEEEDPEEVNAILVDWLTRRFT